jgi:hypothetical protein
LFLRFSGPAGWILDGVTLGLNQNGAVDWIGQDPTLCAATWDLVCNSDGTFDLTSLCDGQLGIGTKPNVTFNCGPPFFFQLTCTSYGFAIGRCTICNSGVGMITFTITP